MNEIKGLCKSFTCRKDPLVQVVSGLKDPNIVLTVNTTRVETLTKAMFTDDLNLKPGEHHGVVLRTNNARNNHYESNSTAETDAEK